MSGNPKSNEVTAGTERRAVALVHYKLNSDNWIFRLETGNDEGRDCVIELVQNGECHNRKIEGQIKGRTIPKFVDKNKYIALSIDVKTVKYALGTSTAFVLFVADINPENEKVYYECVQDYCISNPSIFNKLDDQKTVTIRVSVEQELSIGDDILKELATVIFVNCDPKKIKRKEE